MTRVEIANQGDVESLVELEALLFAEDAGVHDPQADVTWPLREGAADFHRLLADDSSVVLVARRTDTVVGHVVGYTARSNPTRQPVSFGVLRRAQRWPSVCTAWRSSPGRPPTPADSDATTSPSTTLLAPPPAPPDTPSR